MRFPVPDPFDVFVLVLTSAALGTVVGFCGALLCLS